MNVSVIGAGYVGLTTSSVLANLGHQVSCVEQEKEKVDLLRKGEIPFSEPGLDEIVLKTLKNGHLTFTTDMKDAIKQSSVVFIAVGTPPDSLGSPNLCALRQAVDSLAAFIDSYKVIVIKSTVPVGTNEEVHHQLLNKGIPAELFDVVSNPEFLREGSAIEDMLHPDKIVIGARSNYASSKLKQLYRSIETTYLDTNWSEAEMIKYASNGFLATKISFMNELAKICDAYQVNIATVASGLATDPRIGPHFLRAGLGYGGSCLPKDIAALEHLAIQKKR